MQDLININDLSKEKNITVKILMSMVQNGFLKYDHIDDNGVIYFNTSVLNEFDDIYNEYLDFIRSDNYIIEPEEEAITEEQDIDEGNLDENDIDDYEELLEEEINDKKKNKKSTKHEYDSFKNNQNTYDAINNADKTVTIYDEDTNTIINDEYKALGKEEYSKKNDNTEYTSASGSYSINNPNNSNQNFNKKQKENHQNKALSDNNYNKNSSQPLSETPSQYSYYNKNNNSSIEYKEKSQDAFSKNINNQYDDKYDNANIFNKEHTPNKSNPQKTEKINQINFEGTLSKASNKKIFNPNKPENAICKKDGITVYEIKEPNISNQQKTEFAKTKIDTSDYFNNKMKMRLNEIQNNKRDIKISYKQIYAEKNITKSLSNETKSFQRIKNMGSYNLTLKKGQPVTVTNIGDNLKKFIEVKKDIIIEAKKSIKNIDTKTPKENLEETDKTGGEQAQGTAPVSEEYKLILFRYKKHLPRVDHTILSIGNTLISPIMDNDIVKGYRQTKTFTDVILPTFAVRGSLSTFRVELKKMRESNLKEVESILSKRKILQVGGRLRARDSHDLKEIMHLCDVYFAQKGVFKSRISSYSSAEITKLLKDRKRILTDEDKAVLKLMFRAKKAGAAYGNVSMSRKKRLRGFKRFFDMTIGQTDVMKGYRFIQRSITIVYRTASLMFAAALKVKALAIRVGKLASNKKVGIGQTKTVTKINVKIDGNAKLKPLNDRRRRIAQNRANNRRVRAGIRSNKLDRKSRRLAAKAEKLKARRLRNPLNKLKNWVANTKFGVAMGKIGNIVFAPLRFFNAAKLFFMKIALYLVIAFGGLILLTVIVSGVADTIINMKTNIISFKSTNETNSEISSYEEPLAVKAINELDRLYMNGINYIAEILVDMKPSNPDIAEYDKKTFVSLDSDGLSRQPESDTSLMYHTTNTKEIIAMADTYINTIYFDEIGSTNYATKYMEYVKDLYVNTHHCELTESEVTYCEGCETELQYIPVMEKNENGDYEIVYEKDESGELLEDENGENIVCMEYAYINVCPGHMELIVTMYVNKHNTTVSTFMCDKIGGETNRLWEGWNPDLINDVIFLINENWLEKYGYHVDD